MRDPNSVPDPGKTWTWVKYKPSLCEGCTAKCCYLPAEVTAADLLRLGLIQEDELQKLKKVARRLEKADLIQSYRAATGLFTLAQKHSGACVLLGPDGRCTRYENRPDVCRKFPTEVGPRIGFCPSAKLGTHPTTWKSAY